MRQSIVYIALIIAAGCTSDTPTTLAPGLAEIASGVQILPIKGWQNGAAPPELTLAPRLEQDATAAESVAAKPIAVARATPLSVTTSETERVTPGPQPAQEPAADIYAELDADDPTIAFDPNPAPEELAPKPATRARTAKASPSPAWQAPSPEAERPFNPFDGEGSTAYKVSMGVGAAGLAVGVIAASAALDSPSTATQVASGVSLGVGLVAFAVGGIIYAVERNGETTAIAVGPGGAALTGEF